MDFESTIDLLWQCVLCVCVRFYCSWYINSTLKDDGDKNVGYSVIASSVATNVCFASVLEWFTNGIVRLWSSLVLRGFCRRSAPSG